MPTWKFLDSGSNSAVRNMAIDEELLAGAQSGANALPVLRLYAWDPPAVSVGRFQKIETAVNREECSRLGFDIVRRVTGGRAVLHRGELTYSIVARTDDPLFPSNVLGTYKVIASGLVAGLRSLGLPAQIVSRQSRQARLVQKKPAESACFTSPSWYEILVNDRKIVGSAQRRLKHAFLQHGSILLEYDSLKERQVIPGGDAGDVVTSIARELGREVPVEEVTAAVTRGFSQALGVRFQ